MQIRINQSLAEVVKFQREVQQKPSHVGSGACQVLVMAPAQPSYYDAGNRFVFLLGKTQSWHQHMERRLRCGLEVSTHKTALEDAGRCWNGCTHRGCWFQHKKWTLQFAPRSLWLRASANVANMRSPNISHYLTALLLHKNCVWWDHANMHWLTVQSHWGLISSLRANAKLGRRASRPQCTTRCHAVPANAAVALHLPCHICQIHAAII